MLYENLVQNSSNLLWIPPSRNCLRARKQIFPPPARPLSLSLSLSCFPHLLIEKLRGKAGASSTSSMSVCVVLSLTVVGAYNWHLTPNHLCVCVCVSVFCLAYSSTYQLVSFCLMQQRKIHCNIICQPERRLKSLIDARYEIIPWRERLIKIAKKLHSWRFPWVTVI